MRVLASLAAISLGVLLVASPAAASCAPPAPIAENAARAEAVIHGTVTDAGEGAITVSVRRALKGQASSTIRVFIGPGRGATAATSADYMPAVGTDHVLYLIRGSDGQLETNACIGSHAGAPNAAEAAYFGAGTSPDPGASLAAPATAPEAPILPALVLAVLGAALIVILWSRVASVREARARS